MDKLVTLWEGSGLYNLELGQVVMIGVGLLLLYLAIHKKFEPLLLVPIGFRGDSCQYSRSWPCDFSAGPGH